MPRPKVPLENRRRAVRACVHCRLSKKRCNGDQPCANCVRKRIASLCVFEDATTSHLPETITTPRTVYVRPNSDNRTSPTGGNITHRSTSQIFSPTTTTTTLASSPEASHRTHPRLLENARGERVFFGGSASLSFLQFIRDTVAQSLGSSDFSNHAQQNQMFEGARVRALPLSEVQLSSDQEQAFLNLCLTATQGLFSFFTREQISETLSRQREASSPLKPLQIATAQTILAIGAQCSARDYEHITISRSYFAEAQKQAFEGMVEDPSLEMVELFLLMSFYMLGACHRNAAFMYIGIAARAAYALGLHYVCSEPKASSDAVGQDRMRSVWKCLVVIDTITSSILGRPSATSSQLTGVSGPPPSDDGLNLEVGAAMQANYELACLLDQKVQELYRSEKVTAEGALTCLEELGVWSSRLPLALRSVSKTTNSGKAQGQIIGGLHVSCFYYFAVMLVSRPFLVVHLTNRLARSRMGDAATSLESSETNSETEIQEIAEACLNAAMYMSQTCVDANTHGFLPDNMRILKAWLFAAGLVLGFEMFTGKQSEPAIESAFHDSCDILTKLATHSSLAAHYVDILTSLSDAISTRRRQTHAGRRGNKPIVERIMAFEAPSTDKVTREVPDTIATGHHSTTSRMKPSIFADSWVPDFEPDFNFDEMMNEPFLNWESADFLTWDPFSYGPAA